MLNPRFLWFSSPKGESKQEPGKTINQRRFHRRIQIFDIGFVAGRVELKGLNWRSFELEELELELDESQTSSGSGSGKTSLRFESIGFCIFFHKAGKCDQKLYFFLLYTFFRGTPLWAQKNARNCAKRGWSSTFFMDSFRAPSTSTAFAKRVPPFL